MWNPNQAENKRRYYYTHIKAKAQRTNEICKAMPCQLAFYRTCTEGKNLLLVHSCTFYKQLDFKKGLIITLLININFLYMDFDGSEQMNEASKVSLFISLNIWVVNILKKKS